MCGIGGLVLYGDRKRDETELEFLRYVAAFILQENEVRGHQATGVATFQQSNMGLLKQPCGARELVGTQAFWSFFIDAFNEDTKTVLLHTRHATHGSCKNLDNNHPIVAGNIVGVHNGIIWNDRELFKKFKLYRHAQVDSEVIFRLAEAVSLNSANLKYVAEVLEGVFTFACVDKQSPNELFLVRNDNPVTAVYIKEFDVIAFASEEKFLRSAIRAACSLTMEDEDVIDLKKDCMWFYPERHSIWKFDAAGNAEQDMFQIPANFVEAQRDWGKWNDDWDGLVGSRRGGKGRTNKKVNNKEIVTSTHASSTSWKKDYIQLADGWYTKR